MPIVLRVHTSITPARCQATSRLQGSALLQCSSSVQQRLPSSPSRVCQLLRAKHAHESRHDLRPRAVRRVRRGRSPGRARDLAQISDLVPSSGDFFWVTDQEVLIPGKEPLGRTTDLSFLGFYTPVGKRSFRVSKSQSQCKPAQRRSGLAGWAPARISVSTHSHSHKHIPSALHLRLRLPPTVTMVRAGGLQRTSG